MNDDNYGQPATCNLQLGDDRVDTLYITIIQHAHNIHPTRTYAHIVKIIRTLHNQTCSNLLLPTLKARLWSVRRI
jgi:hypothetical protein